MIDEMHITTMCHGQLYPQQITRDFDKKICPRNFNERELVLKKRNQASPDPRGRFAPNYKGPYVVKRAFSRGALILADKEEGEI